MNDWKNSIKTHTFAILILALVSLLPILNTMGKLVIGYDTFIPLIPENSLDLVYQWIGIDNGSYIGNNHIVWVYALLILKKLGKDIYQTAFLYQGLIFFLSGFGIYNIYNLFNNKNKLYGLVPGIFFIFSPHLLDHMPYYQGTVGIVWATYFCLKFIRQKAFSVIDCLLLSISISVMPDLPNPKYHLVLFVLFIASILLGLLLRLINLRDIVRNGKYFILILLLTLYISVPLLHFGVSFFHNSEITINTRADYEEFGQTLDYGAANIYKMITLFHISSLYENTSQIFAIFVYYAIPFVVYGLSVFILPKLELKKRKITILYLILGLFFIFFSKSSNPPFGFVYEWILSSSQFFAFMRTTAGIVIFAALFYSLILGIVFQYFFEQMKSHRFIIGIAMLMIILISGYPIWSGKYFPRGLRLPADYFMAGEFVRHMKLDAKYQIIPSTDGYQGNLWGYYGYIIYPWIFDKPTLSLNLSKPQNTNYAYTDIRYIVHDKTLADDEVERTPLKKVSTRIFASKTLDIYRIHNDLFHPHIRTMSNNDGPAVEYRRINPTKYRVRIHGAGDNFQLILTENFHSDWKLYGGQPFEAESGKLLDYWEKKKDTYVVIKENEPDQLSPAHVPEVIADGSLSTLGHADKPITFISQRFDRTIQNDNLPAGTFSDIMLRQPLISLTDHTNVKGYANGWDIRPDTLCKQISCIKNKNGTYDFELIVEFWPQKLKNMTYVISIGTAGMLLLAYFVNIIYRYLFRAKEA